MTTVGTKEPKMMLALDLEHSISLEPSVTQSREFSFHTQVLLRVD